MRVLMKLVAVLLVAIAAFLIFAVIHAFASRGGPRLGVCAGYVVGALLLGYVARTLWRRSVRPVA